MVITEYHRLGGLNNRHLFSHSSGGWKFKIKVLAGLVSGEASLLNLHLPAFSVYPHMAFSFAHMPPVSLPFLIRTPV